MAFTIEYNAHKNELLKAIRNVSFEEVLTNISAGKLLADKIHHNKDRNNQRLYIVDIDGYAYVVPYVLNQEKGEIFLKTIYPSRKFTNLYLRSGGKNER